MMIDIKALQVRNTFIPCWELTNEELEHKDIDINDFVTVFYDLITRKIHTGLIVDVLRPTIFKKGEEVYCKMKFDVIKKTVIVEINYHLNDFHILTGDEACLYYKEEILKQHGKLDRTQIYKIVHYHPIYKCEDVDKELWEHDLYKIQD